MKIVDNAGFKDLSTRCVGGLKNTRRYANLAGHVASRYLAAAFIWAMDIDADGGTVPPKIDVLLHRDRWDNLSIAEARFVLDWFTRTAPGYFG